MANGWGDLGLMLSGGVQASAENEYIPRLRQNYNAYEALEDAKIKRSQAMARDSLPAAMERLGYSADHAQVLLANASPSMTQLGQLQNPNYIPAQRAALEFSGLTGGNQDLGKMALASAIANNKQLKTADIDSGYLINPYDPNTVPKATTKTVADIGKIGAQTDTEGSKQAANEALAGQRNATKELTDDKRKNPDKHKKGQKTKDLIYNPKTGKIE